MQRWTLTLLLVIGIAAKGTKPEAPQAPTELDDPWSDESLAAALAEVTPLVEKVAGRSYTAPLTVEKMNGEQHYARLRDEMVWIYAQLMPDAPEAIRLRMAEGSARGLFFGALGKYGLLDKVVYINDKALDLALPEAGLSESDKRDAIKLILAHEIGHALEDQVVDLKQTVEELADAEQMTAASAGWEGLATWIEGEVAKELGIEDVFWKLNRLQGWNKEGLVELRAWQTWSTYGQGYRFIGYQDEHGGTEQIWKVLDDPPASTAQIWHPEAYDPVVPTPPRDYAAVLRGVEQKLTKGDWLIANTRIGETSLRGEAIHEDGGMAALEEALVHLRWAHGLELERADREAQIRILEFDDAAWAHRWLELLRSQRTAVNAHRAAELGVPIEVITEPFADAPGDDAILRVERIPTGGGRFLERHQAWVVRGSTAVVVSAERFRPGLRLGWTVQEVFDRLEDTE